MDDLALTIGLLLLQKFARAGAVQPSPSPSPALREPPAPAPSPAPSSPAAAPSSAAPPVPWPKASAPPVKLRPVPPNHVPYTPTPAPVVARARELLRTLALGQGVLEKDPTGTYETVFYRAEPHGQKKGVSAWRHVTRRYEGPR